jgi:hypothetical protein
VRVGSHPTADERLTDQRFVVLLRLLVHRDGHIVHGDAKGPDMHDPRTERRVHFAGDRMV